MKKLVSLGLCLGLAAALYLACAMPLPGVFAEEGP